MAVNTNLVVKAVRQSDRAVAAEIHAIQMRAYAQEAKLLGAISFLPLERTIADIQPARRLISVLSRKGAWLGL